MSDCIETNSGVIARLVFDDDLLAPNLRQAIGKNVGDRIQAIIRCVTDKELDAAVRPTLRVGGTKHKGKCGGPINMQKFAAGEVHVQSLLPPCDNLMTHLRRTAQCELR